MKIRQLSSSKSIISSNVRGLTAAIIAIEAVLLAAQPAMAAGKQNDNLAIFVSGPAILLLALSPIAAVATILALARRLDSLVATTLKAQERLSVSWGMPIVWGAAATILTISAFAILINIKVVALLAIAIMAAAIVLLGMGLTSGALTIGIRILEAVGEYDTGSREQLRTGLIVFIVAAICPFVGWFAIIIAALGGIGAVLESLIVREG